MDEALQAAGIDHSTRNKIFRLMRDGEAWEDAVSKTLGIVGFPAIEKIREIRRLLDQSRPICAISLRDKSLAGGSERRKAIGSLRAMGWTPPTQKNFAHAAWVDKFLGERPVWKSDLIEKFKVANRRRLEMIKRHRPLSKEVEWSYYRTTRQTCHVLRQLQEGPAADRLEVAELALRHASNSEQESAHRGWLSAMSAAVQTIPGVRGLKLAAKFKLTFDGSGGDFKGFSGRLPQGVFDGAIFRGAVIAYIPDGNSYRRADFTDAALPALIHGNFSGAILDGVVCLGSPGPLSISGNFSGVDLTRVVVDVAAATGVVLTGASLVPEMFDSVVMHVPIPNLVGVRGPGAARVKKTIELVNRLINEVDTMGLPGTSELVAAARTATPKDAVRMVKRHIHKEKNVPGVHKVIRDVDKALR